MELTMIPADRETQSDHHLTVGMYTGRARTPAAVDIDIDELPPRWQQRILAMPEGTANTDLRALQCLRYADRLQSLVGSYPTEPGTDALRWLLTLCDMRTTERPGSTPSESEIGVPGIPDGPARSYTPCIRSDMTGR